jgi:NADPH-dependent 2,4-dienoyl-CoA reductase/sulfur reductase-like enzyme/nitrite reductase/ring-hydroxylating ferredoxin subunit
MMHLNQSRRRGISAPMASEPLPGPDLGKDGAAFADVPEAGMLAGHFGGAPVVLVRKGDAVLALGGKCTHYGGPLAEGLFDGSCVRCPWHHAAFDAASGEPVRAPAFDAVASYSVERRGGRVYVTGARVAPASRPPIASPPSSVVIVGGGAAGFAAAEMLRREGYGGPVTLVSADDWAPYDRPNISKDFLAGTAQAEWMPLRPLDWYESHQVDLHLHRRAVGLATAERRLTLDDGRTLDYGALLLATGATPVRLDIPGADLPHVHTVRTMRDAQQIIEKAGSAEHAVVVGASFIGLETAAALVARKLEVHVVAPEAVPMQRVLGPELGVLVRRVHEEHGVRFHLGQTLAEIHEDSVTLKDGSSLPAELVVAGVGVRPDLALAEQAGLTLDRGVAVDEYLETSAKGVFAAGDIARWPDPHSGERIRVEHWVVAERQGQTAARNILGRREKFEDVPFFWSQHYDMAVNYAGHAESWDAIEIDGSVDARDCAMRYKKGGRTLAVVTIGRDRESLEAERAMETERSVSRS